MRNIEKFVIGTFLTAGLVGGTYNIPVSYTNSYTSEIAYAGGITGGTSRETEKEKKKKWSYKGKYRSKEEIKKIEDAAIGVMPHSWIPKAIRKFGKHCDKRRKKGKECSIGSATR